MPGRDLVALLWLLISVVIILGLAYWVTRRIAGAASAGRYPIGTRGREMRVLARLPLGKEGTLVMVQVQDRYFLLGITAGGISTVAEFTEQETAAWLKPERDANTENKVSCFYEKLKKTLSQKEEGREP